MEPNIEAACALFQDAAALRVLGQLLEGHQADLPEEDVAGVARICQLVHEDVYRTAQQLSG
jgi:hypothetical protein